MHDLLILGGRVIDPETSFDSIADVAVRHGTIAAIGTGLGPAATTIEAEGLVVTAGFIDLHGHGHPEPQELVMSSDQAPVCCARTVNHVAISVSDLKRSKDWYCRMFGLAVIQEDDSSVLLGFGESMLVLRPGPNPGTISHFMLGIDGYVASELEARLEAERLEPQRDADSFHVRDPDGLDVQVGDRKLGLAGFVENGFRMK